jgi:hypothetical protein
MVDTISTDGTWSVHQRPRSIYVNGKTFIGATESNGDVIAISIDHSTDTITETVLDSGYSTADDHISPSIYRRDDDRLIYFWAPHSLQTNDDTMYWRISDNALDVSSFGSTSSFTPPSDFLDYSEPVQWNGSLRVYYRVGSGSDGVWRYRVSTDDGQTFGSGQDAVAFNAGRIYVHIYKDTTQASDRLHFALGDHRMNNPAIKHWYLEGGDYYTSDGVLIQSASNPLSDITDPTTVYDGSAAGNNPPKQYDLICDDNGNPYVAFTEHVATGSGGGDGDYRARWAKWDGSQWVVGSEITPMGGAMPESHYYESGLCLDSQDPTTVYVGVEQSNRNYQIQEYNTSDEGSSWTKVGNRSEATATITSPTKRGRPISPRNHDGTMDMLWFAGTYDDFVNGYNTQVKNGGIIIGDATKYVRQNGSWVEL